MRASRSIRIVERPVFAEDGTIERRKLMNLSISCDHRVVDGYDAASFVQAVKPEPRPLPDETTPGNAL